MNVRLISMPLANMVQDSGLIQRVIAKHQRHHNQITAQYGERDADHGRHGDVTQSLKSFIHNMGIVMMKAD